VRKYFIEIANLNTKNIVEILKNNKIVFNGKEYNYEYRFVNDNVLVLRISNKNYFLIVNENTDDNAIEVNLNSKTYKVVSKSELDLMIDKMSDNKVNKKVKKEIFSPMPGIITKLNITENQKVNKGDVMLVLEAMKMENEIKATKECVIRKINVELMKSVEKNELLIELE